MDYKSIGYWLVLQRVEIYMFILRNPMFDHIPFMVYHYDFWLTKSEASKRKREKREKHFHELKDKAKVNLATICNLFCIRLFVTDSRKAIVQYIINNLHTKPSEMQRTLLQKEMINITTMHILIGNFSKIQY